MAAPKIAIKVDWPFGAKVTQNVRITNHHGEYNVDTLYVRGEFCPSDGDGRDLENTKSIQLMPQDAIAFFQSMGEQVIALVHGYGKTPEGRAWLNQQVPGLGDAMATAQVVE